MPVLHIFKRLTRVKKPWMRLVFDNRFGQVRIHPCVIGGEPHYVYPRGLRDSSPLLYDKLVQYASERGYRLKEDQRRHDTGAPSHLERRKWAPVMLFTVSLLFGGRVFAGLRQTQPVQEPSLNHQIVLRFIPKPRSLSRLRYEDDSPPAKTASQGDPDIARQLFAILDSHYQRKPADPNFVRDDLRQIADYYSRFPEVVALLQPLKNRNWDLAYDPDNWDTVGIGSLMEVYKAVIHFNTRTAAQLLLNRKCRDNPICIASPADALLHELLHTHSMLVDSENFIEQGGMNTVIYPYAHEYAILDAERKLYASMSDIDGIRRPQRLEHTGHAIYAQCPVCIK